MTTAYESGTVPPVLVRHRLRIAREYAGFEQDELAELIGVSRNTISNAEKGKVEPRRITLNAWALACEVPVSWLKHGDDQPPPDPHQGRPSPQPTTHSKHRKGSARATEQPVGESIQYPHAA
jgi:transcriptional regulator with XRE-family HTH domain